MYEYINGTVTDISPQYIVIDNYGIGYQLFTPNPYLFSKDKSYKIYTYLHVREDAQILYGFQTKDARDFFLKLLNVSGIGPKGALAILASGEPAQIASAIEQENENFLTSFPGVGKKTARQIILDLKGKLEYFLKDDVAENVISVNVSNLQNEQLDEAILALEALGYSQKELKKIIPLLEKNPMTTDQYIKMALKLLVSM